MTQVVITVELAPFLNMADAQLAAAQIAEAVGSAATDIRGAFTTQQKVVGVNVKLDEFPR